MKMLGQGWHMAGVQKLSPLSLSCPPWLSPMRGMKSISLWTGTEGPSIRSGPVAPAPSCLLVGLAALTKVSSAHPRAGTTSHDKWHLRGSSSWTPKVDPPEALEMSNQGPVRAQGSCGSCS